LAKDRKGLTSADGGWWRTINYLRDVPFDQLNAPTKRWVLENVPNRRLTKDQRAEMLRRLEAVPLWRMTPKQAEVWFADLYEQEPDLRSRVVAIARKNLGQPYRMYLLGEYPYQLHDPEPTLDLSHGDCVVFSEHTYAMALSPDWETFYRTLQRLRYKDGKVGMTTRNHYTVADWNRNNSWLVSDISDSLGASTVTVYKERVDRSKFFRNFGIGEDIPVETITDTFIPHHAIAEVEAGLKPGDFINVVRGTPGKSAWVGHVGIVGEVKDGKATIIHSAQPRSLEEPIQTYMARSLKGAEKKIKEGKPVFLGLKFLRLETDKAAVVAKGVAEPVAK
jgi:hypothetical protein